MSLQSSPSHPLISLPFPDRRARLLKKRQKLSNLKTPGAQKAVKPPPRDTSPEPYSSGKETAGEGWEEHDEPAWVNGDAEDGEWVDEEGERDGFLGLEYHPSFIPHVDKRQYKLDMQWETLQQAVGKVSIIFPWT